MNINGYELELTCSVSPEQYDVFKNGVQVGYLRMRWGCFSASCPDAGGKTVYYSEEPAGYGNFLDEERARFLTESIEAIDKEQTSAQPGAE